MKASSAAAVGHEAGDDRFDDRLHRVVVECRHRRTVEFGARAGHVDLGHVAGLEGAHLRRLDRPAEGTLVDLIVRRYAEGSAVTVRPDDTLLLAYRRMKLFDVSQVPVMDGEHLAGIVDESDIVQHVHMDPARFKDRVDTAMVTKLETVSPSAPINELMPLFARDHVAIVADQGRFLGLVTRIDLLNYLRKQL